MPDYHPPLPVSMEQKAQFEDYTVEVRNRFKRLDLIDRVPDERRFMTLYRNRIKTIRKKKKCKKAKLLSEEALQIAVNRREAKGKEKRKDKPILKNHKER